MLILSKSLLRSPPGTTDFSRPAGAMAQIESGPTQQSFLFVCGNVRIFPVNLGYNLIMTWNGKMLPLPPASLLRILFDYDKETGLLTWRIRGPRIRPGMEAGWRSKRWGYRSVTIEYEEYRVHRIIWKMVTGRDPDPELDHINRIRDDNRWSNLRECNHSQNCVNKSAHGYIGQPRASGKFAARPK